jgi:uncharacterized alkaline shock family protein YloU
MESDNNTPEAVSTSRTRRNAAGGSTTALTRMPTIQGEQGRTTIADHVVAKIIGIAAREVEGVYEIVASGPGATLSGIAQRITGTETRDRGVIVEVGEREVACDMRLVVIYGASIPQVADAIRRNVIARVGEMTGLAVKEINIDVIDLYFPDDEPRRERRVD